DGPGRPCPTAGGLRREKRVEHPGRRSLPRRHHVGARRHEALRAGARRGATDERSVSAERSMLTPSQTSQTGSRTKTGYGVGGTTTFSVINDPATTPSQPRAGGSPPWRRTTTPTTSTQSPPKTCPASLSPVVR